MRIMLVGARYRPFIGGIETHIHEVGTRMADLGHRVTVLTTDPSGDLPTRENIGGIRVVRVKAWPKHRDYYFAPRIYTEISQADCDIIHFQGWTTFVAPIGMLAAVRHNIPFVLSPHNGGHSSRLRNSIRGVQRTLLTPLTVHASRLICSAKHEVTTFRKMGRDSARFTIVYNGGTLPPPSDPPPAVNPYLVLSIGRLERYKGHHRVIEAFPELLRRLPDVRLKIVGTGPYERKLRDLVRDLGLVDCVTFESIPPEQRQCLTDLLCSAGLVVLLSEYEANPMAIVEALSVQRPVLVADTSGLRELAEEGHCRSIPLRATPSMVAAVIADELQKDHEPREVELPNWNDCTQQLLKIYYATLNRNREQENEPTDHSIIPTGYTNGNTT
jgi:glycosyltransferase involved in cell wall biosynthesis